MKVALAQIDCVLTDRQSNLNKIESYIKRASDMGADVALFPELSDTGYGQVAVTAEAVGWDCPDSSIAFVSKCASRHSIAVVCGLAERFQDGIYNSLAVISTAGELLARYRKLHLFSTEPANETLYTTPGDEVVMVSLNQQKCGLSICYDLRFPELYRQQAVSGASVLISIAAWPEVRAEHWTCLSRARAIENQCYFLAVNRCGTDECIALAGKSAVFSPIGEVLCQAGSLDEDLLIADLDFESLERVRDRIPSLYSRRTDVFK
jgi:predicted amidohydrolase